MGIRPTLHCEHVQAIKLFIGPLSGQNVGHAGIVMIICRESGIRESSSNSSLVSVTTLAFGKIRHESISSYLLI